MMNCTESTDKLCEYAEAIADVGITKIITVPRVSSITSVISSSLIIYIIFRSSTGLKSIYHRLMFGMSLGDIISSTAYALAHLPMHRPGINDKIDLTFELTSDQRLGNHRTCAAQGFFWFLGCSSTYLYNAALCWYYYCVIVKSMEDVCISKKLEPFFHAVPVGVSFVFGLSFLFVDAYNPGMNMCTLVRFPWGCEKHNEYSCDTISFKIYRVFVTPATTAIVLFVFGSMLFCLSSIYFRVQTLNKMMLDEMRNDEDHIRQRELLARKYNSRGIRRVAVRIEQIEESSSLQFLRLEHLIRNKDIRLQSFAYVLAFLLTVSIPIYQMIVDTIIWSVPIKTMHFLLQPLQGFFNFLIFVGFKIYFQKNQNPTKTFKDILYSIFFQWSSDPVFVSRINVIENDRMNYDIVSRGGELELESIGNINLSKLEGSIGHNDVGSSSGSPQFPINLKNEPLNLNDVISYDGDEMKMKEEVYSRSSISGHLSYLTQNEDQNSLYEYEHECISTSSTIKR